MSKERGRPVKQGYPPRVDATAEEIAQAMFSTLPDHRWEYLEGQEPVYRCKDCDQEVCYPDTLYNDGRCEDCHSVAV